jgi:hypothetical protein
MKSHTRRHRGFSLVEVSVACLLTAFLATMLSTTWRLLMPSTADLIVWGQLFQEMQIAVAALDRDLGGALPDDGCAGTKQQGLLLSCSTTTDENGDHLRLTFGDVPSGGSDTTIDYYVDAASHTLIRKNLTTGTQFTVARDVCGTDEAGNETPGMAVADQGTTLKIDLTFSAVVKTTNKTLSRKCTLIASKTP